MPDQVLPQITLTGQGAELQPDQMLAHALALYQAGVRAEAEKRVVAGPLEFTADVLQAILMEVAGGHLNLFRVAAGAAMRVAAERALARQQLPENPEAAADADAAAMQLGSYLAASSSNAVMDGYHLNVNAKIPPKEAARRSVRAFGLTVPQMRTAFRIKDDGVKSSVPGAWLPKIESFVGRAFGQRVLVLVDNSLRQVEHDAILKGWERGLADGTIPVTATKVWFTAADERTCPVCAPMDGAQIPVMDSFHLPDGNKVKTPGVHVNCRCTCELVTDPEEISKALRDRWSKDPRVRFAARHKPGLHMIRTRELDGITDGQPRKEKRIAALDVSGGIRTPLAVNTFGERGAFLMNGHHRLEAAKRAGMKKVPVNVRTGPYVNEVSKADRRWVESEHPRTKGGRFGTKVKEADPEILTRVQGLVAGVPDLELKRTQTLSAESPLTQTAPLTRTQLRQSSPLTQQTVLTNHGSILTNQGDVLTRHETLTRTPVSLTRSDQLRTTAILGGQTVNLTRLNMTHQIQLALVRADDRLNPAAPKPTLPPERVLHPMGRHYVAFATANDLDVNLHDTKGGTTIRQPLRFVDGNDKDSVRDALDYAMRGLDQYLVGADLDVPLRDAEGASDPGIVEAAAALRSDMLSGPRTPKGEVRVSISPEDAKEAWRNILSPTGSGYRAHGYMVEAYDGTGHTVARTIVGAETVAAMTNVGVGHPDLPHVVVAPYGAWNSRSGVGKTTMPPEGSMGRAMEDLFVTGPFNWEHDGRTVVLTPDADAYRRAFPENH